MALLLLVLLVLAGVALGAVGLLFVHRNGDFNQRTVQADGVVVGHREHLSTSSAIHRRIYFPQVRYTTAAGQELEAQAPAWDEPPPLGSAIPLLYDPRDPSQVSFTGPRGGAGLAWGLTALGCGGAAATALAFVTFVVLYSP